MASQQVNPKNKKDTLRDMFDDSHADTNTTNAEEEDLDDSVKDKDFDPAKEPEDEESGDEVKVVEEDDAVLSQVRKANAKLQNSVKNIPGLHPDDKVRFEKYNAVIWKFFNRSVEYNAAKKVNTPFGTCQVVVSEVNGLICGIKIASPLSNTTATYYRSLLPFKVNSNEIEFGWTYPQIYRSKDLKSGSLLLCNLYGHII